jgi:hypothetical protein
MIVTNVSGNFDLNGYTFNNYKYKFDTTYTTIDPPLNIPVVRCNTPLIFTNLTTSQMNLVKSDKFTIMPIFSYSNLSGSNIKLGSGSYANYFKNYPLLSSPTKLSYQWINNTSLSISFNAPSSYSSPITNYLYSLDGGNTFTSFSPAQTTSPVTISGLSSVFYYNIQLVALNSTGPGPASAVLTVTPYALSDVALITKIFIQDNSSQGGINIFFNNFSNINTIINYQYTTDGGSTFTLINSYTSQFFSKLTSPLTISYLSDLSPLPIGSPITLQIQAVTSVGSEPFSPPLTFTLGGTVPDPPTINSINFINNKLFIDFTPGSTNGVTTIIDYMYSIDGLLFNQAYQKTSPIIVDCSSSNPNIPSFLLAAICANGFVTQYAYFTYP